MTVTRSMQKLQNSDLRRSRRIQGMSPEFRYGTIPKDGFGEKYYQISMNDDVNGAYVGTWLNGKRHGHGSMTYHDENIIFEGTWYDDKPVKVRIYYF